MNYILKAMLGLALAAVLLPCGVWAKARKAPRKEIAVQLYSVRDLLCNPGKDLPVELKKLADMGYTAIEAANYNDGQFYERTPEEFRREVEAAGMRVLSSHCSRGLSDEELASCDFTQGLKWWDQCIAAHKAAGMSYIVCPGIGVPSKIKDLQSYCDYFNEVGRRCREHGMQFGYHNHSHEFGKVEDHVMLDYMIENTDPQNVFIELDVYWAVMGAVSPVDYFNKYPGRFKVLHIKDHREVGQSGMVGFDAIFCNVKTAGVENIVVEVEQYSYDVETSVKKSIEYLLSTPCVPASYCE